MSNKGEYNKKAKSELAPAVNRRERARLRKEAADKRTPQEQLARLDAGSFTAVKERLKLTNKLKGITK